MYFGIWFMANCSIIAKNQFWFMIMRQILWAFMFLAHSAARCWAGSGTNYHLAAPHRTTTSLFMVRARRLAVAASMRYARTGDCRQIPHCRNGRFWSLLAVGAIRNYPVVQPSFACFSDIAIFARSAYIAEAPLMSSDTQTCTVTAWRHEEHMTSWHRSRRSRE